MDQNPKSLDEMADEILERDARRSRKSLRKLGIIDDRRQRTIRDRELTMSYLESRRRTTDE